LLTPPPDNPEELIDESTLPQPNKDDGIRRSQRLMAVVKPMDEKEEPFKFNSAVTWGEEELRLLNVSVMKEPLHDLDAMVFNPQGLVLPVELEERKCLWSSNLYVSTYMLQTWNRLI
jgi:hypothetical protein